MTTKLKYEIAFCSGFDERHNVSELCVHSPETRGWQSPK